MQKIAASSNLVLSVFSETFTIHNLFPDKIHLFTAELDEKIIAGVVNFICNKNTILAFYLTSF